MKGTQFAQFSTEVLQRGAAAVLPQYLPDRWLDALLEEADLLAPGEGGPEEGDSVHDCCAGLLGAVLVVLMAQRDHADQLEGNLVNTSVTSVDTSADCASGSV